MRRGIYKKEFFVEVFKGIVIKFLVVRLGGGE